ncbi:MAG: hypothetical protein KDD47_28700 [Acidobacteria bacterium]|nr:hypothetical protein [Acidobacteriota bacterium]
MGTPFGSGLLLARTEARGGGPPAQLVSLVGAPGAFARLGELELAQEVAELFSRHARHVGDQVSEAQYAAAAAAARQEAEELRAGLRGKGWRVEGVSSLVGGASSPRPHTAPRTASPEEPAPPPPLEGGE